MPRCPACGCRFRTLDDEEGMHECPACGLSPHAVTCASCDRWGDPSELDPAGHCPDCSEYHRCEECGAWMIDHCPETDCPQHKEG